jgi:hypothetical protein
MSHKIAQLSLDFAGEWSVCSGERRRQRLTGTPLKSRLISGDARSAGAGRPASPERQKSAPTPATSRKGSSRARVKELVHEVNIFLNAVSLFNRLGKT